MAALAIERLLQRREEDKVFGLGSGMTILQRRLALSGAILRDQPIERLIALGPRGTVLLYLRGDKSRISLPADRTGEPLPSVEERLRQAASVVHNHPVNEGRPIGGTFSVSDITLAERLEMAELCVVAVEATYTLRPAPGFAWHAGWVTGTENAYARTRASLERAMMASPQLSKQRDIYFFLRTYDFLMLQLAKRCHMVYQREDQPPEGWRDRIPMVMPVKRNPPSTSLLDDTAHFRWLARIIARALPS